MRADDFDYSLPEELIAQVPLEQRDASRLLVLNKSTGEVTDCVFRDCIEFLEPGDVLVLNDTRVTAKRLFGRKPTGAQVELFLLKEEGPGEFWCLAKPGRRLQPGAVVAFDNGLTCTVTRVDDGGQRLVTFAGTENWRSKLEGIGQVPLPPYVHTSLADGERYQTVYSAIGGSAAAPTAGLHFTEVLLEKIREKGVQTAFVSLDVSLDTFRPLATENVSDHVMHGETCRVSMEAANTINSRSGRVIAVGTTSVRTLESFAHESGRIEAGEMDSRLFIKPGYQFRIVNGMFTNFHMPKTTMLLMISAMAGREAVFHAYQHAIESGYRFLSFGDSMLIV